MSLPEQLTVTTALIGLLAVGGRMIDSLWNIDAAPQSETAFLNQALQAVKQCRSSIHVLYKTLSLLESSQLPFPERAQWLRVDGLVAVLADTVLAFSELQIICDEVEDREDPIDFADVRQQYGTTISSLCSRIRWLNLSVTMMMTVLKCPGDADAQSSKEGLDQRVARLLTSNSELSRRMRSLQEAGAQSPGSISHPQQQLQGPPYTSVDGHDAPSSDFSSKTLATAPVLSVIPLPVNTDELRDGPEVYTFAFAREASNDLGLLMHIQTGPEALKLRTRTAMERTTSRPHTGDEKRWNKLASAVGILSRKKRRKG